MAAASASHAVSKTAPEPTVGAGRPASRGAASQLKLVPTARAVRETIRAKAQEAADRLDKTSPLTRREMESLTRRLLSGLGLPHGYAGWTMVSLASAFWRDQVAATPTDRRLLLLPHCLRSAEGCPAKYGGFGLECRDCGQCSIVDFRSVAERLGYHVLVAEGSPVVLSLIVSGQTDAIIGVGCLNVLEKVLDKVLLAGVPCMAVPLLSSDCRNTSVDEDWVSEMIHVRRSEPATPTRTYVHLMRAASHLFQPDELRRLAPPARQGAPLVEGNGRFLESLDPIAGAETLAYDFLAKGGKYARPFITLAVYDALTGGRGALPDGARSAADFPDAVKRTAMSIETFHKASLVHDDIEDNDDYRYGDQTLHRKFGTPTAINVGDYMIGLGYRFISREASAIGAEAAVDILNCLAEAHTKLSEGQGAELLWRDSRDKRLQPIDALKIYALKTAPAFEAAIYAGIRLARPVDGLAQPIKQFTRDLGTAYQILNDLKDWRGDEANKRSAGGDILGGRPTLLWALALQALSGEDRAELLSLVADPSQPAEARIAHARRLYCRAEVFHKARRLVEKHRQRAEAAAEGIEPAELHRLCRFLIDMILDRPDEEGPPEAPEAGGSAHLPINARR